MAKIIKNRGTSSSETDDVESNWAGEKFKKYQQDKKQQAAEESITSGRGTSSKQLKDIPDTELPDTKGVSKSTKRGTEREDHDCNC